jgi:hypothetical protein
LAVVQQMKRRCWASWCSSARGCIQLLLLVMFGSAGRLAGKLVG